MPTDAQLVADLCRNTLALAATRLPDDYGYRCLPLCVIDAVFSIGVTYGSTRNTVHKFCKHLGIDEAASDLTIPHLTPRTLDHLSWRYQREQ